MNTPGARNFPLILLPPLGDKLLGPTNEPGNLCFRLAFLAEVDASKTVLVGLMTLGGVGFKVSLQLEVALVKLRDLLAFVGKLDPPVDLRG